MTKKTYLCVYDVTPRMGYKGSYGRACKPQCGVQHKAMGVQESLHYKCKVMAKKKLKHNQEGQAPSSTQEQSAAEVIAQSATSEAEHTASAMSPAERYIERNRKIFIYGLMGLFVIISAYLLYRQYVIAPREETAAQQIFTAEHYFGMDSLRLALEGDGNFLGFRQMVEEYGRTRAGNLARYYAGLCCRELGDYQQALKFLEDYKAKDEMLAPLAHGARGDCYVELGEEHKAITAYKKAASYKKNKLTTPFFLMRLGLLAEKQAQWSEAQGYYDEVKTQYPQSMQAREVDKALARVKEMQAARGK